MRLLDVGGHRLPLSGEPVQHDVPFGIHVEAPFAVHAVGLFDAGVVFGRREEPDHLGSPKNERLAIGPVFHPAPPWTTGAVHYLTALLQRHLPRRQTVSPTVSIAAGGALALGHA